jgi:hypothetical protein
MIRLLVIALSSLVCTQAAGADLPRLAVQSELVDKLDVPVDDVGAFAMPPMPIETHAKMIMADKAGDLLAADLIVEEGDKDGIHVSDEEETNVLITHKADAVVEDIESNKTENFNDMRDLMSFSGITENESTVVGAKTPSNDNGTKAQQDDQVSMDVDDSINGLMRFVLMYRSDFRESCYMNLNLLLH